MSLSVVSLNTRGLRNNVKRKALFLYAKQLRMDFVFFQETHSLAKDSSFWKSQWGNELWLSHGTEKSAGVSCLKSNFFGQILQSVGDCQGHYLCLVTNISGKIIILVNFYGYNSKSDNDKLIDILSSKLVTLMQMFPNAYIIVGGDFNVVMDEGKDRWPSGKPSNANASLKSFMYEYDLIDVWREKSQCSTVFTWSNKSGSRQSRLDYWLVSKSLCKDNIKIDVLPTPLTDHKAVTININLFPGSGDTTKFSYWKMNSSLLKHECVKKEITRLVTFYWDKALKNDIFSKNWELLKFEIGKYLRKYGSELAKMRRIEEEQLVSEITSK